MTKRARFGFQTVAKARLPVARASRGELWWVNFNPTKGREQRGRRPALVFSVDGFNHGPAGMVSVVPLTTKNRGIRSHVEIRPPEGGLTEGSYAMSEQLRAISKDRLESRIGAVSPDTLEAVEDRVRMLLGL